MAEDNSIHQSTWALLPWLANGTATPAQQRQAQAHLDVCPECREALAREQQWAQALSREADPLPDTERGLASLMQRLDQAEAAAPRRPAVRAAGRSLRGLSWVLAGVGTLELAALAGLLLLGLPWLQGGGQAGPAAQAEPVYRTLSAAPAQPDAGTLHLVFDPRRPVGELSAVLQGQGLTVVRGPSEAGVWSVAPAPGAPRRDADAQARLLRQVPGVQFAEATASAARP